jgi:hypothetical protein
MIIGALVVVGAFVFLIDPFYHYHKPLLGTEVYLYHLAYVYQTPGVARNLEYDSGIVGTSMTENTRTTWFDEGLGWQTVKLSYSSANMEDYREILGQMYQSGNEVKNVVMDINTYQLMGGSLGSDIVRPEYLYNGIGFDDVNYLFNKGVISAAFGRVVEALAGKGGNMAEAYTWEDPALFGKDLVLEQNRAFRAELRAGGAKELDLDEMLRTCRDNLVKLTTVIEAHPETQFNIYYPPYSMIFWEQMFLQDYLRDMLEMYAYSIELLLPYDNVHIFYFQDEAEIISNLDNYRDYCHHSPQVNYYIYECIRDGVNEVSRADYRERIENMYMIATGFDYDAMWE